MTAKEYLQQYRRQAERIRQIDIDIEKLRAEAESMSAGYTGMPRGTRISDKTGRLASRLADLSIRKEQEREEAWKLREEIEAVIQAVRDPVQSRVLYDRYIMGMKWDDIAAEVGYDTKHVAGRIHGKALQEVAAILR